MNDMRLDQFAPGSSGSRGVDRQPGRSSRPWPWWRRESSDPVESADTSNLLVVALISLVFVLAVFGAYTAVGTLSASREHEPGVQELRTSFGTVTVERVEQLDSLMFDIAREDVVFQISVALANQLQRPVDYTPDQFVLITNTNRQPIAPASDSLHPGTLQPNADIEGNLRFVLQRDTAPVLLEYRDPGRATPLVIDLLGAFSKAPADRHHH